MDTATAFLRASFTRGRELKVFDWNTAAKIIKKRNPVVARAGLRDDWENTGGDIYKNGEIITDSATFLASTWAIPELYIDGEYIECYKFQSGTPNWTAYTRWPKSAIRILKGDNV